MIIILYFYNIMTSIKSSDKCDNDNDNDNDTKKQKTFKGQVKWFDYKKGYGFIQKHVENGESEEIFVHYTKINTNNEFKMLCPGEHVEFEETECPGKGIQAEHVRAPFNGKLMNEFKSEYNTLPQRPETSQYNNYNSIWSNNILMKNLRDELNNCLNTKGKGKGKGRGKGKNDKGKGKISRW